MNKVYCGKCKHYKSVSSGISFGECFHPENEEINIIENYLSIKKITHQKEIAENKNKNNDCPDYERLRWWHYEGFL